MLFVNTSQLLLLPQRYVFSSKSQLRLGLIRIFLVVVATTKVRIFKQITTYLVLIVLRVLLLLLPQRYVFSSKSQHFGSLRVLPYRCCCYHKGTYFQANHNNATKQYLIDEVVVATTKVRIFKQITTDIFALFKSLMLLLLPQRYVFSSKSQLASLLNLSPLVVVATTKVRIFKQITTAWFDSYFPTRCCCYHKGTYFQANHNAEPLTLGFALVVVATTKVRIFKQITTNRVIDNF